MEGIIHKKLKQIGANWMKTKVTDLVCIEAKYLNLASIADVAGINLKRKEIRIIEVKATRQDFLRDKKLFDINTSYYMHCNFFYIMCPMGVITVEDIPKEYGLIWVDFENNDNIIVKNNPKKYTGRLKTQFNTSLKNISRAVTNYFIYKGINKEFYEDKDKLDNKFSRKASISFCSIRCSKCNKVTKKLINKETIEVKCDNCDNIIKLEEKNTRIITKYNKKFIDEINKLN